jgi:hypothetical protein
MISRCPTAGRPRRRRQRAHRAVRRSARTRHGGRSHLAACPPAAAVARGGRRCVRKHSHCPDRRPNVPASFGAGLVSIFCSGGSFASPRLRRIFGMMLLSQLRAGTSRHGHPLSSLCDEVDSSRTRSERPRRSKMPRNGPSASLRPVALHSGDGFFFAHSCHFGFAEADSREEQMDEVGR